VLLRDLVTAAEDLSASDAQAFTMDQGLMERWPLDIQAPFRTPSRTRPPTGQHVTLVENASDDDKAPSPISPGFFEPADPLSPSLDLKYEVEDEDERAWRQSLPSGLWDFIVSLKVGLEKASHSALSVHRESYLQWITTGKDLVHSLDVWVEDSTDSLGAHQTLTGIMASNVWDGLAQLSSKVAGTAVIVDSAATETLKIRTEVDGLRAKASSLSDKLSLFAEELSKHSETIDLTQEIARAALGLMEGITRRGTSNASGRYA
jgi:hypothetical protein